VTARQKLLKTKLAPIKMASLSASLARVGKFVKFFKSQWGEKWAKDTYDDWYEKLFDWVKLLAHVPATAKKKSHYLFEFEGESDYTITEDEVDEAAMQGDVVGTHLHSRTLCCVVFHLLPT
jgi:hypothetical protein